MNPGLHASQASTPPTDAHLVPAPQNGTALCELHLCLRSVCLPPAPLPLTGLSPILVSAGSSRLPFQSPSQTLCLINPMHVWKSNPQISPTKKSVFILTTVGETVRELRWYCEGARARSELIEILGGEDRYAILVF